jgi:TatD DNase family protein
VEIGLADTHCHLSDGRFDDDLDEVLARAARAGVTHILAVGAEASLDDARACARLAEGRESPPVVRAAAGVHPHDASAYDRRVERDLEELLSLPAVVAVGETGLDYHYDNSPRDEQKEALAGQLALARRLRLPVVLHCREAAADLLEVLKHESPGGQRGVVHCFTGSYDEARRFLDHGLAISFAGVVTFKKAAALREVAARLPLDRLMVETDAPYLAPEPKRGGRNEPALVIEVARTLAAVHATTLEKVIEATAITAADLFFGD